MKWRHIISCHLKWNDQNLVLIWIFLNSQCNYCISCGLSSLPSSRSSRNLSLSWTPSKKGAIYNSINLWECPSNYEIYCLNRHEHGIENGTVKEWVDRSQWLWKNSEHTVDHSLQSSHFIFFVIFVKADLFIFINLFYLVCVIWIDKIVFIKSNLHG